MGDHMSILERARELRREAEEQEALKRREQANKDKEQLTRAVQKFIAPLPLGNYELSFLVFESQEAVMPSGYWTLRLLDEPLRFALNTYGELVVRAYFPPDEYRGTRGQEYWSAVTCIDDLVDLRFPTGGGF